MSQRTRWINPLVWRDLPPEIREDLLEVLDREDIVERYAGNVESMLHDRGEHKLAFAMLEALQYIPIHRRRRSKSG